VTDKSPELSLRDLSIQAHVSSLFPHVFVSFSLREKVSRTESALRERAAAAEMPKFAAEMP
jgi:hypothetical protein